MVQDRKESAVSRSNVRRGKECAEVELGDRRRLGPQTEDRAVTPPEKYTHQQNHLPFPSRTTGVSSVVYRTHVLRSG